MCSCFANLMRYTRDALMKNLENERQKEYNRVQINH